MMLTAFLVALFVVCLNVAEARCSRKYAIKAALDADRAWYKAINEHNYQAAIKHAWCKGSATLVEPIGPKGQCVSITNSFPITLNFFNDLEFSPVIRDVRYHCNGTVTIHSADIIVINGTSVAAHDSYRWYDAKSGSCDYKLNTLYAINWLCLEREQRGCACANKYD